MKCPFVLVFASYVTATTVSPNYSKDLTSVVVVMDSLVVKVCPSDITVQRYYTSAVLELSGSDPLPGKWLF